MADEAAHTCSQVTGSGRLHTNKTFKLSFKLGTEKSGEVSKLRKMSPEKPKTLLHRLQDPKCSTGAGSGPGAWTEGQDWVTY